MTLGKTWMGVDCHSQSKTTCVNGEQVESNCSVELTLTDDRRQSELSSTRG